MIKKILYIISVILLFFSCKQKQEHTNTWNNQIRKNHHEKVTINSDLVLDTLVFNKNTNGKALAEKYALGQSELNFYKQFISENQVYKKQILNDKHSKTEITYLGKLMDLDNHNFYHVITNFKIIGIGEMISPRGKSNIAFINKDQNKIIIYQMDMPDELPIQIENKILYFNYQSKNIGISILGGLPPILCLPNIGCY